MIHYKNRKDRIYLLTLDTVLASDVVQRLTDDPRMEDFRVVAPPLTGGEITVEDLQNLAQDTIQARVIVLDVRACTLPPLQETYNRVSGFNRADLNETCHSVCIGDGPPKLFHEGADIEVFVPHLAKFRLDYLAGAFFFDPFMHYTSDERMRMGLDFDNPIPQNIPGRLREAFTGQDLSVDRVRRYLRAASSPAERRQKDKARRERKVMQVFKKRISESFHDRRRELYAWLTREGYAIGGETLRLNLYPLFFEDCIADLMWKSKQFVRKHHVRRPGS